MHRGMTYARLEALGGIQWPCYHEDRLEPTVPARPAVGRRPGRAGAAGAVLRGRARAAGRRAVAPSSRCASPPGRRLDSYNTGVQSSGYASPLRFGRDDRPLARRRRRARAGRGRADVRVVSRRGDRARRRPRRRRAAARPRVHDAALPRRGRHEPAHDRGGRPQSGTAEFKATAVRIEKPCPANFRGQHGPPLPRRRADGGRARRGRRAARPARERAGSAASARAADLGARPTGRAAAASGTGCCRRCTR